MTSPMTLRPRPSWPWSAAVRVCCTRPDRRRAMSSPRFWSSSPAESAAGLDLRPFSSEDCRLHVQRRPELREHEAYFAAVGTGTGYAVSSGDELAHVACLITELEDRALLQRNVKLRTGEAEISY